MDRSRAGRCQAQVWREGAGAGVGGSGPSSTRRHARPPVPLIAADSNGDSNSSSHRLTAATGGSA
jgi:hypothetical protein